MCIDLFQNKVLKLTSPLSKLIEPPVEINVKNYILTYFLQRQNAFVQVQLFGTDMTTMTL